MHVALVQMSRWDPATVVAHAQFLQRQGAAEQVEALYEEALTRCGHTEWSYDPASADPELLVEYAAVVMGTRPEQAEELLRWAVENEPYHVPALCMLASVLHSTMQRSQEAEEVLEIALSRVHSTVATVQLEKSYDTVSRAKASVLSQFAAFYEDVKRHQEAELHYMQAMQEHDCQEDTIWQYCRKLALDVRADTSGELLKRRDEALQRCESGLRRLLKLDSRNVSYYMLCGYVMMQQHLHQEGVSMFRFAYRLLPLHAVTQASCPLSLGQLCFEAGTQLVQWGDIAGATELFNLVLEAQRDYADKALVSLAMLKGKLGEVRSADIDTTNLDTPQLTRDEPKQEEISPASVIEMPGRVGWGGAEVEVA